MRAALLALAALGSSAPASLPPLFATTAPKPFGHPTPDGRPATIVFPGLGAVTVIPQAQQTSRYRQCFVILREHGRPDQQLTLVGEGETEALTCTGIRAFGRVTGPGSMARIAFVYTYSTASDDGALPVVITRRGADIWRVDQPLSDRLQQRRTVTIPAIRSLLAPQG